MSELFFKRLHYHTVVHYTALQCFEYIAVHYNILHHAATHCNTDELVDVEHRHYLQQTVIHCNTLRCSILQHTAMHFNTESSSSTLSTKVACNTLRYTATHYTAVHCNTLQRTSPQMDLSSGARILPATICIIQQHATEWQKCIACLKLQVSFRKRATNCIALFRKMTYEDKASYGSSPPYILQYSSMHCNARQHSTTQSNTLQRTVTHCNTLQHTAKRSNTMHCDTLQHTATYNATHCNTLQYT